MCMSLFTKYSYILMHARHNNILCNFECTCIDRRKTISDAIMKPNNAGTGHAGQIVKCLRIRERGLSMLLCQTHPPSKCPMSPSLVPAK